ncbi:MAG: hypothetical protein C4316_02545 [Chloroflexota bacterium]
MAGWPARRPHAAQIPVQARLTRADLLAPLLLGLAVVGAHHRLLDPDLVPSGYDLLTYFYPYRVAVTEALAQGRLPLWNPYIFGGAPLFANIQAAVLYPPNLVTLYLPPFSAFVALIFFHLWVAGLGMYLLGRLGLGLGVPAALLAALTYGLSGFLAQQLGHPNQTAASAWLPWVLLGTVRLVRGGPSWLPLTALFIGLQLLAGHPQETYLTLVAAGLLAAYEARGLRFPAAGIRILGFGLAVALGFGLAAVQVLPSWELSRLSIRGEGLSFREAVSFSLPPWELLRSLLPTYGDNPFNEFIAYVGFIPLGLALAGVLGAGGRPHRTYALLLGAIALALAMSAYNPLSPVLYDLVPGLRLFRVPARWLLLYTLAVALLAGIGLEAGLDRGAGGQRVKVAALWLAGLLVLGFILLSWQPVLTFPEGPARTVWVPAAALTAFLATFWPVGLPAARTIAWALILPAAVELSLAVNGLEVTRVFPAAFLTADRPALSQLRLEQEPVVLSLVDTRFQPGDQADVIRAWSRGYPEAQVKEGLIFLKYKEAVVPNLGMVYRLPTVDGYDGGMLPSAAYWEFKRAWLEYEASRTGRPEIVENLHADSQLRFDLDIIPDSAVLSGLGVRYVVMDKTRDRWVDGVYYDLSTAAPLRRGDQQIYLLPSGTWATAVGVISRPAPEAHPGPGEALAVLTVVGPGEALSFTLRAGVETGPGGTEARPVETADGEAYLKVFKLPRPTPVSRLVVEGASTNRVILRALSLVDERNYAVEPVPLDPALRLVHSGDLKLYRVLTDRPKVYLARDWQATALPDQAVRAMAQGRVVVERQLGFPPGPSVPLAGETVEVSRQTPEELRVRVRLLRPALLVFAEAFFPGWTAAIDGRPAGLIRVNYLFQGLELPAGDHEVTLSYRPATLRLGLTVTGWSLLLWVLALGFGLVGGRVFKP